MLGILLTLLAFAQFVDKRYQTSLLIFFGLITNGYQLIPAEVLLAGSPIEKTTDLALLYLLAVLAYRFEIVWQLVLNESVFRWVTAFLIFVMADALYSRFVLHYDLPGVVKIFRNYLFLLSFGVFVSVPVRMLERVWYLVALITVVQCLLYVLQIPTGVTLLASGASGSEVTIHQMDDIGYTRFYNTPTFLTPALLYFLFAYRFRSRLAQGFVLVTLVLAVLGPLHRTNMITLFLVIGLTVLLQQRSRQRLLYTALIGVVGYAVTFIDLVNYRINEALLDVQKTFSGSLTRVDHTENTASFRLMHFMERFNYIMDLPHGWCIGLGMLHEDTPQAARLPFEVGNYSKHVERIAQTETSDLLYSLLLMQVGLVGTVFFLILLYQLGRYLYQRGHLTPYARVGLLWLIHGLLTSVSGVELALSPFRTLVMLFVVIAVKTIRQPTHSHEERSTSESIYHHAVV